MASLQLIRRRIRSVKGIHQITKAQQLVAASKLRRVELAARAPQAYTKAATELLERLSATPEVRKFPLFAERKVRTALTVIVAGDRGLAGAYNANVMRAFGKHVRDMRVPQKTISIGRRASTHLAHIKDIEHLASYDVGVAGVDVAVAQPVLQEIIELFLAEEIDAAHLIYTSFTSTVKQDVMVSQLLPIARPQTKPPVSDFEPEAEELLAMAARRVLEAQLLQAIVDSRASEEAARMVAMMNATDNAGDLIDDLTLAYNSARQANITQDLAEISAGAEAITA